MSQNQLLMIEAHRGAISRYHENSLEAFLEADRLGISGIEFDVWMTLDEIPVIAHGKTDNGLEVLNSIEENCLKPYFIPNVDFYTLS